ncbi:RAP1 DNA-binding protein RAP1 [Candida maltosa Xu316]
MNYNYTTFDDDDGRYTTDLSEATARAAEQAAGQQQQQYQLNRRTQMEAATRQAQELSKEVEKPKMRGRFDPPKTIFVDKDNKTMLFYIPKEEPNRIKYRELIIKHGGLLVDKQIPTAYHLSNNEKMLGYFKLKFIDDCIANGGLVPLLDYGTYNIPEDAGAFDPLIMNDLSSDITLEQFPMENASTGKFTPILSSAGSSKRKGTNRFTAEQDEFILEQVRMKPRYRHSHQFYHDLSQTRELHGHTGNSIRSRYRRHLEPLLSFVYKTDDRDRLMRDGNANLIKVGLNEIPGTLKNKFTAEDDYFLCSEAINNLYRKRSSHTLNSWRDRYRKYVDEDTIPQYIEYYENCMELGEEPQCLTRVNK